MKHLLIISLIFITLNAYSQADHGTNISGTSSAIAEPLGWLSGSTNDLDIVNQFSGKNIYFRTNGSSFLRRMTILSSGEVGIGDFTPAFLLDVDQGDINLNTSLAHSYMISGSPVLWHNSDNTSIFVGVNAGNSGILAAGGINNTLIGNSAGTAITTGKYNTAIGFEALKKVADTDGNTAVGWGALHELVTNGATGESVNSAVGYGSLFHSTAYGGCALGFDAGYWNTTGCQLVAIGEEAAFWNNQGNANMAIGEHALFQNRNLSGNIAIGFDALQAQGSACSTCVLTNSFNVAVGNHSLFVTDHTSGTEGFYNTALGTIAGQTNTLGSYNLFVGFDADVCPTCTTLTNATAIGANCIVPNSNELILGGQTPSTGYNNVRVGIGLSGDNSTVIGPSGPRKPLEINADPTSFVYTGGASTLGESGLRFRQLTTGSTAGTNLAPGVLSVNNVGDVVLVNEAVVGASNGTSIDAGTSKVQLGQNASGGSGANLLNDRDIPQADYNIYFTEPGSPSVLGNNIALGVAFPLVSTAPTRLTVEKVSLSTSVGQQGAVGGKFTAICGVTDATANCYGIWGVAYQKVSNTDGTQVGGYFEGKGSTGAGTYGVYAVGSGDRRLWGGKFDASGNSLTSPGIGVEGNASGALFNIGVKGTVRIGSGLNYGVYGDLGLPCPLCLTPGGCPACTASTAPDYAGYFNGDVLTTTGMYFTSDENLKENIQSLSNSMDIINQLEPKSFTYKQDQNRSMYLGVGTHYGLIAQDVENILPGLVKESVHPARYDSLGNEIFASIDFKALNYTELIPFLIGAIKEQEATIEMMQAQISNCCNSGNRQLNPNGEQQGNSIDIELTNAKAIVLNQNVPNPFAEQTSISYFISDDVSKAQIFFYDNKGTILKIVDINEKGAGQLNVYAADLSSGQYKYTLIADGKVIETKTMVKQ